MSAGVTKNINNKHQDVMTGNYWPPRTGELFKDLSSSLNKYQHNLMNNHVQRYSYTYTVHTYIYLCVYTVKIYHPTLGNHPPPQPDVSNARPGTPSL